MMGLFAAVLIGLSGVALGQPVFQAAGTAVSGTGSVSPLWPAHEVNDVAFLIVETQGNQTPSLGTANGFVSVGSNNAVNSAAGTRLTVFWARATSNAMAAPVINDPGDHLYAQIITYRGAVTVGNPWNVTATGNKTTAGNTVSLTGVTTTLPNSRVLQIVTRSNDAAGAAFSGQANANLAGIAERSDGGTDAGNGGGFAAWDGVRTAAGATGNTSANINASVVNAFRTLALPPRTFYSRASGSWSTGTTWSVTGCGGASAGAAPVTGAEVVICNGNTVTLNTNSANLGSLAIQGGGLLNIGNNGTARTLTVAGAVNNAGTLRYNTAASHVISIGGAFDNGGIFTSAAVTGGKTMTVAGLITNTGTFRFAGSTAMTVNANGGIVNGATLDVSAASDVTHTLNVRADFVNNGTVQFRPDANSLVTAIFNGSAAQAIGGASAATTFHNLTLNNANGLTVSGAHDITVLNVLALTSGVFTTGNNVLAVTNTAAGGVIRNTGFIEGGLTWSLPAGNPGVRTFPVGTGTAHSPAALTFTGVTTGGNITVRAMAGDHPDVANSGVDEDLGVNRYWTVANAGVVFGNYSAVFNWVPGDLDAGADTGLFEVRRLGGVWNATTPGTRTATSIQVNGLTGFGEFVIGQPLSVAIGIGRFNAYDTATAGGAVSGLIRTKVAGGAFSLDIIAIRNNRKNIETNYNGTVRVELLNAVDSSGTPDSSTGCNSSWTPIQTVTSVLSFAGADNGRKTLAVTENNAWPNVRVRITELPGATRVGCSTDAFAIRPASLTVSASDADSSTAGTGRLLDNTGPNGGNIHRAGRPFTVTAAAVPATASNYDGNPTVLALACTLPAGCVDGLFDAGTFSGSGARISSTATYSEAGVFNLTLVDETYTLIDATDGTPADCSPAGRFICQGAAPLAVGRFVPDRFEFSAPSTPMLMTFGSNSCGMRSFTYVGQPFWYNPMMLPSATVRAVNAAGDITVNYPFNTAQSRPVFVETYADASAPGAAPIDFSGIGTAALSSGAGAGSYAASPTGVLRYTRTTPVSEFNAAISLTVNASDNTEAAVAGNGTISATLPLVFDGGGSGLAFDAGNALRYGRLRLVGASGAPQLPLRLPFELQYWTGTFFALNAQDACTTVSGGNVALGNIIGGLATSVTGVSAVSAGRGAITLGAPKASGSVDVAVLLGPGAAICPVFAPPPPASGDQPWLRGQWCGVANDRDPKARARFGVGQGTRDVIFMRENY